MKKTLLIFLTVFIMMFTVMSFINTATMPEAHAQSTVYTVKWGDSMWKIAVKFEVGLAELIKANPSIKNPALIYVGQKIYIPEAAPLKTIEDEVLRLTNLQRSYNGLPPLTYNWQVARVARIKSRI